MLSLIYQELSLACFIVISMKFRIKIKQDMIKGISFSAEIRVYPNGNQGETEKN